MKFGHFSGGNQRNRPSWLTSPSPVCRLQIIAVSQEHFVLLVVRLALVKPWCDNPATCIPHSLNSFLLWLGYANSFLNPIIIPLFPMLPLASRLVNTTPLDISTLLRIPDLCR